VTGTNGDVSSSNSNTASPASTPTNSDLSLLKSESYFQYTRILDGKTSSVSFIAKDSTGRIISQGGLTVVFELAVDGTSSGTFSAVTDNSNGLYTATFTGTSIGTSISLKTKVGGSYVTSLSPQIQVGPGSYFRKISVVPATTTSEYQVKVDLNTSNFDYSKAKSDGSDLRFYSEIFAFIQPFDYWIEKWDSSGTSTIWVQVAGIATSAFYLFYGNDLATSNSSKIETFSYSAAKDLYYNMSSYTAGSTTMSICNYGAAADVTATVSTGTETNNILQDACVNFSNTRQGVISAVTPIVGRVVHSSGHDTVMPISFATSLTGYPKSRGADQYRFFNPNAVDAAVTLYDYDSSGTLLGTFPYSVTAGNFLNVVQDFTTFGLVESSIPILTMYNYSNASDVVDLVKGGKDLLGVIASSAAIGFLKNGTSGTAYHSNATTTVFIGDKGGSKVLAGGGSQNAGVAVRVISNKEVVGAGQADGDGSDSEAFWPVDLLEDDYLIPTASQYVKIACHQTVNITVLNPDTSTYGTGTCTPTGNTPGVIDFGDPGAGIPILTGSRVLGDKAFYLYYEYSNQDESNLYGIKHARPYQYPESIPSIGSEGSW